MLSVSWQSILNFLTTKTLLWEPFTARMEILTFHFFNPLFVGDFNSKLESFGCAHRNPSGPMLKNIQKQLNLIYLNNDEHMHMNRVKAALDMAFISPNLAKHDIQFQIGDDLGSDHLPI